jgi:hypothetical protein
VVTSGLGGLAPSELKNNRRISRYSQRSASSATGHTSGSGPSARTTSIIRA